VAYQQSEIAEGKSASPIVEGICCRKTSALDRCDPVRQQIVLVPISEAGMLAGCRAAAIEAEKLDLRLGHNVTAGLATHYLSGLVVIYTIVPELFPTLRADVTGADFEQGLYRLTATCVVMDQRMLREVARVAFHADFARMQAGRIAILTDVQAFEKPSAQHPSVSQLLEDGSSITDPE
jgi:hypothetical protein